jgi:hypothetical protein
MKSESKKGKFKGLYKATRTWGDKNLNKVGVAIGFHAVFESKKKIEVGKG